MERPERRNVGERSPQVTPIHQLEGDLWLLELFHGPTYAFKDVALQFLGTLFELILTTKKPKGQERLTIVGATSGDTGSSAIAGVRGKEGVECFILYPENRTSPIQEAQMCARDAGVSVSFAGGGLSGPTRRRRGAPSRSPAARRRRGAPSLSPAARRRRGRRRRRRRLRRYDDSNIHAIALRGAFFDDCQKIVKGLFADTQFHAKHALGAVNSINWARIVAQIVYYFYAAFQLRKQAPGSKPPCFSVPTGNFGDVLAGWYVRRAGYTSLMNGGDAAAFDVDGLRSRVAADGCDVDGPRSRVAADARGLRRGWSVETRRGGRPRLRRGYSVKRESRRTPAAFDVEIRRRRVELRSRRGVAATRPRRRRSPLGISTRHPAAALRFVKGITGALPTRYAKEMGCPCRGLVVATNSNDILARFFASGRYEKPASAVETLAPSMDICVSSNFERFVFHCAGNDTDEMNTLMDAFESTGKFAASPALHAKARSEMHAAAVQKPELLATIQKWQTKTGYVLDPHTAIGVRAVEDLGADLGEGPVVCLACAHYGKFPAAVEAALGDKAADIPEETNLTKLLKVPHRKTILANSAAAVIEFIEETMAGLPKKPAAKKAKA